MILNNNKFAYFLQNNCLIKNKFFLIMLAAILSCVLLSALSACSTSETYPTVKLKELPNEVVENSQVSDEYAEISNVISKDYYNEFFAITKIPHTSGHLEQISSYITAKLNEYGVDAKLDTPSGCIYGDVPATNSDEYKNKPTIILQAHLDMVGVSADDYTNFDPDTMAVEAVYDDSNQTIHSRDYKTNIGADNGCGMAFILAALKNQDNFNHGPLRLLFTTNEETTFDGAIGLTSSIVDAPYLINVDGYQIGNLLTSCAGNFAGEFNANFDTVIPESNDILVTIDVTNLAGGHTGEDVTKSRLHPSSYMASLFKAMKDDSIDFKISEIACGQVKNAYATGFKLQFYIDSDQKDNIEDFIADHIENYKQNLTDENDFTFNVSLSKDSTQSAISKDNTYKFVDFLSSLPEGVMKESELSEDVPETSCAYAVLDIKDGLLKMTMMLRSSNNDTLNEYRNIAASLGDKYRVKFNELVYSPAWARDPNNKLRDVMLSAYNDVGKFSGVETATHGGLETAYFIEKNPNIQMISIGPDYHNEHTVNETIYATTTNMFIATILYTLQNT